MAKTFIYRFFRNIKSSYKFPFLVIIIIIGISERISHNYNEKQYEKRNELFSGDIKFIFKEDAKLLIEYKTAYDSLFYVHDSNAIKNLNLKYHLIFEKLKLSENIISNDNYLLIEFDTKVETDLAIMITNLSPNEIFEQLHIFMHHWTLFSEDGQENIYIVKDILK